MPPFLKDHHIQLIWSKASFPAQWNKDQITRWVAHAGGTIAYGPTVTGQTTHLVCSDKVWKENSDRFASFVQTHERAKKLVTVSIDWLVDCLRDTKKYREAKYLWSKLSAKKVIDISSDDNDTVENSVDLLVKHTKKFVDKRDQASLEAKHAAEDAQRAEEEARERREQELAREYEARVKRENAALIRRGCRKSRNEIFSDDHHIYRDFENFSYDITLTKVDLAKNRNERVTVTIYESNAEPHTYATNLNRAGTDRQPTNNALVAIGATFPVARRQFVRSFEELSRKAWEDRFEPSAAGDQTQPFDGRPFIYVPPKFGPRGEALYLELKDVDIPATTDNTSTPLGVSVEKDQAAEVSVAETIETGAQDNAYVADEPAAHGMEPETIEPTDKDVADQDTESSGSRNNATPTQTAQPAVGIEMTEQEQEELARSMSPAELDADADAVVSDEQDLEGAAEPDGVDTIDKMDAFEEMLSEAQKHPQSQEHDMYMRKQRFTTVAPPALQSRVANSDAHDSGMSDSEGPGQLSTSRKRKWEDSFEGFED